MTAIELSGVSKDFHRKEALFSKSDVFHAVEDLSFSVRKGETVGIVGTNAAGKTTLMRLIAGILSPTHGRITVGGGVLPLLGFNTCLHHLLTAKENIGFLLSLHKMPRSAQKKIFPQIVDFFGMPDFLDMPLKNFSDGMISRLSFSIGVHLPSDILLLDEILAVGNEAFQKKCLEKIQSMRKEGKTILFSSHRMDQVQKVCDRVLWIHQGQLALDGSPDKVVAAYLASQAKA